MFGCWYRQRGRVFSFSPPLLQLLWLLSPVLIWVTVLLVGRFGRCPAAVVVGAQCMLCLRVARDEPDV